MRHRKRSLRAAFWSVSIPLTAFIIGITFPYLFFKDEVSYQNIHIYCSDLPRKEVINLAKDVYAIIQKSDLYDPNDSHKLFITSSALQYGLFTLIFYKSAGFYNANGNAFIRPISIRENRLIKFDGTLAEKNLTLPYVLAHETTHSMTAARIGKLRYIFLPEWIREGIAESDSRGVSFKELLSYRKTNNPELYVRGKYLLYALRIEYLRCIEHLNSNAILNSTIFEDDVDHRIDRYVATQ